MSAILEVQNVSKSYKTEHGPLKDLDDITFKVEKGSWLMLVGASGSGKTTLLQLLGALDKPGEGKIFFQDFNFAKAGAFKAARIRRSGIGFVFQGFNLLPELSALENIMLPGLFSKQSSKKIKSRALELLEMVILSDRATHKPSELSGGEQQRIAIARALINDPQVILADEPTGNLDPATTEIVIELFRNLQKKHAKTIIMVTHDMSLTKHASNVLKLNKGRIVHRA